MQKGKPFDVGFSSRVVFSPDGRWAIVNRRVPDAFLIQLSTGNIRKLPGQSADFLPTRKPVPQNADVLIRPGVGVGRIRLGMTRQQVGAVLGAPRYRYYGHKEYGGPERDAYTDLLLAYNQNRLISIETKSAKFKTADGLSFQSSFNQIKRLHPIMTMIREDPFEIWAFSYNDRQQGIGFGFEGPRVFDDKAADEAVRPQPNQKPVIIGVYARGANWRGFYSSE